MKGLLTISVILLLSSSCSCSRLEPWTGDYFDALVSGSFGDREAAITTFNPMDYGAVGNGQTDDSLAFIKAWEHICAADGRLPTFYIPPGKTFLLGQVQFKGPCKASSVRVRLSGSLIAPHGISWGGNDGLEAWIRFENIDNLIIDGEGKIDGQGQSWWTACAIKKQNVGKSKCQKPTAFHIHGCNGLKLSGLTHLNSAKNHISLSGSNNVIISNIRIIAPEESPNTDGIDISTSSNVMIKNSFIGTGDDCIAINSGSSWISITGVTCGPGHGISIGSLGEDGAYQTVEGVNVENCSFRGTDNGVRIKTWKGGRGYARKISFKHINFMNTKNPIVINQFYFDKNSLDPQADVKNYPEIKVSDVAFSDLHGTSANEVAISLNCNEGSGGCSNILMDGVRITPAVPGMNLHAICSNAHGKVTSATPDVPCLSH
ncbi:hypothetical protein SLEP1_g32138 [Rubroshorea leprosula]|uniref:Polygalacturonase n=1 Tax=Rubroshorea leprosula TaxID=152421 RepID=A0AAV5KCG0_9ROSI|nr:hypothetical protein SLEP1_g32138 [Rubroshorea leprosula]